MVGAIQERIKGRERERGNVGIYKIKRAFALRLRVLFSCRVLKMVFRGR
uniref:Uncharacterized protein n=1 Tax=Rhizophora mucronata TaxID=61149 RepID=A0A2P2Q1Y4_RHIMU